MAVAGLLVGVLVGHAWTNADLASQLAAAEEQGREAESQEAKLSVSSSRQKNPLLDMPMPTQQSSNPRMPRDILTDTEERRTPIDLLDTGGKATDPRNWAALLSVMARGRPVLQEDVPKYLGPPQSITTENRLFAPGILNLQKYTASAAVVVWHYSDGGIVEFVEGRILQVKGPPPAPSPYSNIPQGFELVETPQTLPATPRRRPYRNALEGLPPRRSPLNDDMQK